ncbi:Cu(I)-responsive transcriptional regulator [Thalassobaculum fulvum]|uniref:Cu(I)-responsive transcriptional regulator n=1 Tax=Thalassobaculum fulvum TaxID=1633335 RepID=A0A918XNU1_9PROT|nr:Cu(I)-responsive transcriptional regulator [Thalassobaculum fulvum]
MPDTLHDAGAVTVGEAADAVGLPAKTLRYYEEIGLVVPDRRGNGYRAYRPGEVHRLRFLKRARSLGFSIDDCRVLLSLYGDPGRTSSEVKAIAQQHREAIEHKVAELLSLRDELDRLIDACHGDHRPDCPILDNLAGGR